MTPSAVRERVVRDELPADALAVCATLRGAGHGAWLVGGCVRDHLLGRRVTDWDVCTSATPDEVARCFKKVIRNNGEKHGTVMVMLAGVGYEVTTLRGEGAYSDGRRPDHVFFVRELAEDLARRDFTVNAIAYDPERDALVDPFDGLGDLRRGVLRAVRDPRERFREDGLRVLRGARFVASLGFELEPATRAAIEPNLDTFRKVSPERVRDEWWKTAKARAPSSAFRVMAETGIFAAVLERAARFPAFERTAARPHPRYAERGCFELALAALDRHESVEPAVRLSALLAPLAVGDEDAPAPGLAAERVEALLRALRCSRDEVATGAALARHYLAGPPPEGATDAAVRRWLRGIAAPLRAPVFALEDALYGVEPAATPAWPAVRARAQAQLDARVALVLTDLAIDGKALQSELAVPPSKRLGLLLDALLDAVLEAPDENRRDALLARARAWLAANP